MSQLTAEQLDELIERLEWQRDEAANSLTAALAERDKRERDTRCNCIPELIGDEEYHADHCASLDEPTPF
jgi:hypothetical protein